MFEMRVLKKPLEDEEMRKVEEDFLDLERPLFWEKYGKEKVLLKETILKDLETKNNK